VSEVSTQPYIAKRELFNGGHIILESYMGNEIDVLSNARVSFNDDVQAATVADLSARDVGVLNFLMREHHGTPWEAPVFRWDVKAPLFVFREWHRHRTPWSYNEWSARYSKMDAEFYVPEPEQIRTQVGRPGSYTFETIDDPLYAGMIQNALRVQNQSAFDLYENMMEGFPDKDGNPTQPQLAKEVARTVLPVAMYSRMKAQSNLRGLFNFFQLRSDANAQYEIRQYSLAMEEMVAEVLPLAMELFNKNGRVAP
jgi:thymidylate synthase (FAD)